MITDMMKSQESRSLDLFKRNTSNIQIKELQSTQQVTSNKQKLEILNQKALGVSVFTQNFNPQLQLNELQGQILPCYQPTIKSCKNHQFCERTEMQLTKKIDEQYPVSNHFESKGNKNNIKDEEEGPQKKEKKATLQEEFLAKEFPLRGIVPKKKLFAQGMLSPDSNFFDDQVQFYGVKGFIEDVQQFQAEYKHNKEAQFKPSNTYLDQWMQQKISYQERKFKENNEIQIKKKATQKYLQNQMQTNRSRTTLNSDQIQENLNNPASQQLYENSFDREQQIISDRPAQDVVCNGMQFFGLKNKNCCSLPRHQLIMKSEKPAKKIVPETKDKKLLKIIEENKIKANQIINQSINDAVYFQFAQSNEEKQSDNLKKRKSIILQKFQSQNDEKDILKSGIQSKTKLMSESKMQKFSLPTSPVQQNDKTDGKTRLKDENSELKNIRSSIQNQQKSNAPDKDSNKQLDSFFFQKMHYRFVHELQSHSQVAKKQFVNDIDPKNRDFQEIAKKSNLVILTKEEIEKGKCLSNFKFGQSSQNSSVQNSHFHFNEDQNKHQDVEYNKHISNQSIKKIIDFRVQIQNQQNYADTILINARTGKQLKLSQSQNLKGKNFKSRLQLEKFQQNVLSPTGKEDGSKSVKNSQNQFQQYQNKLFAQNQNDKIAVILNQGKSYQLSQLKEDYGIMKYIKKQYQDKIFTQNQKQNGSKEISQTQLEQVKENYFKNIISDFQKQKLEIDGKQMFDKIEEIDQCANNIYKDFLKQKPGLNVKNVKINPYQFEDDILNEQSQELGNFDMKISTNGNLSNRSQKQEKSAADKILNIQEEQDDQKKNIRKDKINLGSKNDLLDDDQKTMHSYTSQKSSVGTTRNQQSSSTFQMKRLKMNGTRSMIDGKMEKTGSLRNQIIQNAKSGHNKKSIQQVYLEADYWYHKGVVLNQKQENKHALECYKQALNLNKDHKASIFNLACAFEKLQQYEKAQEWFQKAINVDQKWPDAHYGITLCCLKLKKYDEAVVHIQSAVKWSIEQFQEKVKKRKEREQKRLFELEEQIAAGNMPPGLVGKDLKIFKRTDENSNTDNPNQIPNDDLAQRLLSIGFNICPEDDDSSDEFYIDPATKRNDGVSTYIMYVKALSYREVKNYKVALESYQKVMKSQEQIQDYEKMIVEKENQKNLSLKIVEGPSFPGWIIDLYSHFKRLDLLKENNRQMMIDLRRFYEWKEGWHHDKIPEVIKDLQRIRFFNRFDSDTLYQMMRKTDLRVVNANKLLFLDDDKSGIVLNGQLYLFSHSNDVATPILQAIYNPGDIIGNSAIDQGWSRQTHSWVVAYQECDILLINTEYSNYLWDKMKSSSDVCYIAKKMQSSQIFKNLSEQTIYTIAFDMLKYKKFEPGEKICEQYTKSQWNVEYLWKQKTAVDQFINQMQNNQEHQNRLKQFLKENNPVIDADDLKDERYNGKNFHESFLMERFIRKKFHDSLLKELNRRETIYGKKLVKKDKNDEGGNSNRSVDKGEKIIVESDDEGSQQKKVDIFKLNLPKFPSQLKQEQLEDEKKKVLSRQPAYAEQVEYSLRLSNINSNVLMAYNFTLKQKLKVYSQSLKNLPQDPQGIYILLDGVFTVKNDFNCDNPINGKPVELYPKMQVDKSPIKEKTGMKQNKQDSQKQSEKEGDRPECMDIVGAEKFLQVQGYTYYGSLYAAGELNKNKMESSIEQAVKCGFIDQNLLHLIPFYDFYKLKQDLEDRYKIKCEKLKKSQALESYNYILKKILKQ